MHACNLTIPKISPSKQGPPTIPALRPGLRRGLRSRLSQLLLNLNEISPVKDADFTDRWCLVKLFTIINRLYIYIYTIHVDAVAVPG